MSESEGMKRKADDDIETIDLSDSDSDIIVPLKSAPKKANLGPEDVVSLDSDEEINFEKKDEDVEESEPEKHDRLVKEFILITKTDSSVANYFLEQHNWKLNVRIN